MSSSLVHEDNVLRALTDDGAFRVIAADTTATVRGAIAAQKPEGAELTRIFADMLTGAVLIRESMAPEYRLQAILQGNDKRTRIVADTHADGQTRGLLQMPTGVTSMQIDHGVLQVARTLHNGALHQGVVEVPQDNPNVSGALMAYLQVSEQVATVISVGAYIAGGEVVAAGGFMVQLLPELEEGPLAIMTERLKDFLDLVPLLAKGQASPSELLAEVLYGMPYTKVGDRPVSFGCQCSPERLMGSLASLPKNDIESLLDGGKTLDIECDYCRKNYQFTTDQLKSLLQPAN